MMLPSFLALSFMIRGGLLELAVYSPQLLTVLSEQLVLGVVILCFQSLQLLRMVSLECLVDLLDSGTFEGTGIYGFLELELFLLDFLLQADQVGFQFLHCFVSIFQLSPQRINHFS